VTRYKHTIDEMKLRGEVDFATLSVAVKELEDLISS
jgi:NAD-specific glutamate dehydrogenase